MKKLTKGLIAAGAASILLLGGAGSLAYWSDSENVDGGAVTAGTLSLGAPACDVEWVYAIGNAGEGGEVDLIVPGDIISKECTFTINATGDNLEATLTIPASTPITTTPSGTTFNAIVGATYASSGGPITPTITAANDGNTVTATIQVEFPFGDETAINANDMQGILATLDTIPITLTQTES